MTEQPKDYLRLLSSPFEWGLTDAESLENWIPADAG